MDTHSSIAVFHNRKFISQILNLLLIHILYMSAAASEEAEWVSLFNGKDLSGWKTFTNEESFTIVDGSIKSTTKGWAMNHLYYVGDHQEGYEALKNFELQMTVRADPNSNSGIFIHSDLSMRSKRLYMNTGYEIQLNSTQKEKRKTGSLYEVVDLNESNVNETKWFKVYIKVVDQHILVKINDQITVDYTEPPNPKRSKKKSGTSIKA